jgi:hypothetical protein
MVSPELISASKAPSASPLNNCAIKLGQLIMKSNRRAGYKADLSMKHNRAKTGAAGSACFPRHQDSGFAQV